MLERKSGVEFSEVIKDRIPNGIAEKIFKETANKLQKMLKKISMGLHNFGTSQFYQPFTLI